MPATQDEITGTMRYRIKATILKDPSVPGPGRFERVAQEIRATSVIDALAQAFASLPSEVVALSVINLARCSVHDIEAMGPPPERISPGGVFIG